MNSDKMLLSFCKFIGNEGYKINGYDDGMLTVIINKFLSINDEDTNPSTVSDEAIQAAKKEYPIARNADLRISNKAHLKITAFIKGYKAAKLP